MTTKPLLKGSLFITVMIIAAISVGLILKHPMSTQIRSSPKDKDYQSSLAYMRKEVQQLNQHAVGKQIHQNTRLDNVWMNERDKIITYQLTLLDVTGQDIDRVSDGEKKKIMLGEKQILISKSKDDVHLAPLFLAGWTIEYVQKTNDGDIISDITINGADIAQEAFTDSVGNI
ncbi:hypothetical protein ACG8U7_002106 [Klebsiella aerogenes]